MNKENELLFINKEGEIICFSKTLKSRLELIFPIKGDLISFNPNYEKIKSCGQGKIEIYLELKDDFHIWDIITIRLKL